MGYQNLYNLANQSVSMISAWLGRTKQCNGDWSKEQIQKLIQTRKIRKEGLEDDDEFEESGGDNTNQQFGMCWWIQNMGSTRSKEVEMSAEDRKQYSVGRGMLVFGNMDSLDQLSRDVYSVRNLVHKVVMDVLASNLPVSLPYPVLITLAKLMCRSGGVSKLFFATTDKSSQLVESRYVNRVYMALLDTYNVFREIMFKHAAETSAPNFASRFSFLRSALARNHALLASFHDLNNHKQIETENIFFLEMKEFQLKLVPSKLHKIVLPKRCARDRVVISKEHIFVIHAEPAGELNQEAGLVVVVHLLKTGEIIKRFTAVPLDSLAEGKATLFTKVCVLGDFMALSLSQGYPKESSSSGDHVFVVNWEKEKLVMSQDVPHSTQLKSAVKAREEFFNHSDSENGSVCFNESYSDDDDMINTSLDVFLTRKAENLFLIHREIVLPDMEYITALNDGGQHVRIWGHQDHEESLVELENVRLLDVHGGLVIYMSPKEVSKGGMLTSFKDIDVDIKWLDLVSGKEVYQENFPHTEIVPVFSIDRTSDDDTLVLQYKVGEEFVCMYKVTVAGEVEFLRKVAFPVLKGVIEIESSFSVGAQALPKGDFAGSFGQLYNIQLLSNDMISFSQGLIISSRDEPDNMPDNFTRCVLAKKGTKQPLAEVYIRNVKDNGFADKKKSNGYHSLSPADRILQEDNRLVIMRTEKRYVDWKVTVRQFEFQKPAEEVIKVDENIAREIVTEAKKTLNKKSESPQPTQNTVMDVAAMDGKRLVF